MKRMTMPTAIMAILAMAMAFSAPAFAQNQNNASITLNSPAANGYNNSAAPNLFIATPTLNGTDPAVTSLIFSNCSLWINVSGTWKMNQSNASVVNATALNFTVNGLVESGASYKWNVNCTTNNTESTSYTASANRTSMFDRGVPNITVVRPSDSEEFADNPGYFSVSANETVNFSVRAFNAGNTIENISMGNSSTTATYTYVFYSADRMYWAQFFANDSAGNVGVFTNYTFWYKVTGETGGGAGGRRVISLPTPAPVVELPEAVAEAPAAAVGVVETVSRTLGDIANAIVGFFQWLIGAR